MLNVSNPSTSTEAETRKQKPKLTASAVDILPPVREEISKQKSGTDGLSDCDCDWEPSDPGLWPFLFNNSEKDRIIRKGISNIDLRTVQQSVHKQFRKFTEHHLYSKCSNKSEVK